MSCSAPVRLPRSLHESPAYDPSWRFLQVEEYLRSRRHLGDAAANFILPSSERDSTVRAYFKFRCGVIGPRYAAFRYAEDCAHNERLFMASRIRAMTVAGLTAERIAARLHTPVENIATYLKVYFEVADYLADRETLGAILAPMLQERAGTNPRERIWLLAALKLGVPGLEYVMDQRVQLSAQEQKEINESIHAILAEQTLSYVLALQAKPEAGADVLTAFQKSQELRLRAPAGEDESKRAIFNAGLGRILAEKMERARGAQAKVGAPTAVAPAGA